MRKTALLLAALLFLAPSLAWAGGPEGFVKDKQGELAKLIKKGKSDGNDKKIEAVFDELLDYERLARESLHDHWQERSEAERKEFQGILKRLVRNAYRRNLKKTLDYNIEFRGETKAKTGYLVRTVARSKKDAREEPISVDYVLHQVDGRWLVYDIVTEGSSLVNNYRNQFRRVIKKNGFEELLRRMKRKLAEERS
jgi:phospholipid transport system substrate-binding protein